MSNAAEARVFHSKLEAWMSIYLPHLMKFFDFEFGKVRLEDLGNYLDTTSTGNSVMARFAATIFANSEDFDFSIVEAKAVLDDSNMAIIVSWLNNQF